MQCDTRSSFAHSSYVFHDVARASDCCGRGFRPSLRYLKARWEGFCILVPHARHFDRPFLFMLLSLSILLALVLYDLAHQILPPSLLGAFVVVGAGADFRQCIINRSFSLKRFVMLFYSGRSRSHTPSLAWPCNRILRRTSCVRSRASRRPLCFFRIHIFVLDRRRYRHRAVVEEAQGL